MFRKSKSRFGWHTNKKQLEAENRIKNLLAVMAVSPLVLMSNYAVAADAATSTGTITRVGSNTNLIDSTTKTANIRPEQVSAKDSIGLNRFTKFSVANGEIANLYFNQKDGPTINTLINMVQNKIDINGTVNAIRNNQIGGNLYFFSPQGMVVGASGVINAGSLTVMAPSAEFFTKAGYASKITTTVSSDTTVKNTYKGEFLTINLWGTDATTKNTAATTKETIGNYLALQGQYLNQGKIAGFDSTTGKVIAADISMNKTGSIKVHGTINAATAVKLAAVNTEVTKTDAQSNNPLIQTGVVFKNTVNSNNEFLNASVESGKQLSVKN